MMRERERERERRDFKRLNNLLGKGQYSIKWCHFIKNTCILFLSHIIHLDFNDQQKLPLIQRDSDTSSEDEGKEATYMTHLDS